MDNALALLGLAYRARKIVLGEEVYNNLKKIKLMVIASDISQKSKERCLKKCSFYNIAYVDRFTGEQLSDALGKGNIKLIGIVDEGFKKSLLNKI